MQRTRLGRSGIEVSRLGLGGNNFGWRLDVHDTRCVVDAALDAGVNFFDTADIYGRNAPGLDPLDDARRGDSERLLGQVLSGRRDQVVLATKFGNDMGDGARARGARAYLRRALEGSLQRLRTDYVDLLYYHRLDGVTPLAETVGAMLELVREGTVRAIGCSDLRADQLREVGADLSALQNRYSLLRREDAAEVIPTCRELGVAYIPFSPLADGLLTGKYRAGASPPAKSRRRDRPPGVDELQRVERLARVAHGRGATLLQLALAWPVWQEGIASVIAGATSPEQVRANADAVAATLAPGTLTDLTEAIERADPAGGTEHATRLAEAGARRSV